MDSVTEDALNTRKGGIALPECLLHGGTPRKNVGRDV
jgi:hypothetical protein